MIDQSIISFDEESLLNALLYGWNKFNDEINREVLLRTIFFIKSTKHFERPLFSPVLFHLSPFI